MGAALGLLAGLCYGGSDFVGGVGGRRTHAATVALLGQPVSLVAALVAMAVVPGQGPTLAVLAWGALSGIGSGVGTVVLYRGLSVGRMSVVSPICAVVGAAIPAMVGVVVGGARPGPLVVAGLALALPAVVLVSSHRGGGPGTMASVRYGVAAGCAFALLFIALNEAGTASGAWPLVPSQVVAVLLIVPVALAWSPRPLQVRASLSAALLAGALGGLANLLFLAATGRGELTIVAVLASLYPAVTVVLARFLLSEHWRRVQVIGLALSGAAVVLITVG